MHTTPHNRPQMPASEPEPQGPPDVLLWVAVSLALWLLIAGVTSALWPQQTFDSRWPAEEFKLFPQHNGHLLPRAPLMPWWIERVIV